MKLSELSPADLLLQNRYGFDRIYTRLTLTDTDWMNYRLAALIPTRRFGRMHVQFEYFGAQFSEMTVKYRIRNHDIQDVYTFPSEIFERYILKFLHEQIRSWNQENAFYAGALILDFYNSVLRFSQENN